MREPAEKLAGSCAEAANIGLTARESCANRLNYFHFRRCANHARDYGIQDLPCCDIPVHRRHGSRCQQTALAKTFRKSYDVGRTCAALHVSKTVESQCHLEVDVKSEKPRRQERCRASGDPSIWKVSGTRTLSDCCTILQRRLPDCGAASRTHRSSIVATPHGNMAPQARQVEGSRPKGPTALA